MKYLFIGLFTLLSCATQTNDEPIVLINLEQIVGDVETMAKGISILNSFEPKVIGIDFQFSDVEKNDAKLIDVLNECKNLVMSSEIEGYGERLEEYPQFRSVTPPTFLNAHGCTGFKSLIEEEDVFSTVKRFSCCENVNGKKEYQFGVQAAMLYDSLKTAAFIERYPKINDVDFHGRKMFKTFEMIDLINGNVKKEEIKGKILLLGYLGPGFTDRFYSGAIQRGNGSFVPDMYAIQFYAHVIKQVLSE